MALKQIKFFIFKALGCVYSIYNRFEITEKALAYNYPREGF